MKLTILKKNLKFLFIIIISVSKLYSQNNEIDSLETLLRNYKLSDTTKVNLLNNISKKYYLVDREKTLFFAKKSNDIAKNIEYKKGLAESYRLIGNYNSSISNYELALLHLRKSLELFEYLNNKQGIAQCKNDIGNVHFYNDNCYKALEYYQESLSIYKELNNQISIIKSYNNIGLIYTKIHNYQEALDLYIKSFKKSEEVGFADGCAYISNNLGNIYSEQNVYDSALFWYNKSIIYNKKINHKYNTANTYSNISIVKLKQANIKDALFAVNQSYNLIKNSSDFKKIAINHTLKADIYLAKKDYDTAFLYANKGLNLALKIGARKIVKNVREILAKIYAENGDYKKAYENYIIYKQINDSIFNVNKIKRVTALEYSYKFQKEKEKLLAEHEKKDAKLFDEIKKHKAIKNIILKGMIITLFLVVVILYIFLQKRKGNLILQQQKKHLEEMNKLLISQKKEIYTQSKKLEIINKELNELNNTKNKFFSIIAHDLRNPFNAVLGLSGLLKDNFDNFNTEKRKRYITIINESARNSYKLLENLLTWSRSQMGKITFLPDYININSLIDEVINQYKTVASEKSIHLVNKVSYNSYVYADKEMLLSILRNLISNAIKFTHKGGTVKLISEKLIEKGKKRLKISIIDNGIGISEENLKKLFKINEKVLSHGTCNEEGTGLGLLLCKEFVEKHEGIIYAESVINKGSKFIFTIPVEE